MRILKAVFCMISSLLSVTIWRLICIIGLLCAVCNAIVISPVILAVEAKSRFQRWYLGDAYLIPRMYLLFCTVGTSNYLLKVYSATQHSPSGTVPPVGNRSVPGEPKYKAHWGKSRNSTTGRLWRILARQLVGKWCYCQDGKQGGSWRVRIMCKWGLWCWLYLRSIRTHSQDLDWVL